MTLCEVNQSGGVASKGDGSDQANKRVTIYESWSIPQYVKPDPNLATLRHYFLKDYSLISDTDLGWYRVKPANNHKKFKQTLRKSNFLKNELETSSLLSYLYFEDGAIIYDEKKSQTSSGRFISRQHAFFIQFGRKEHFIIHFGTRNLQRIYQRARC